MKRSFKETLSVVKVERRLPSLALGNIAKWTVAIKPVPELCRQPDRAEDSGPCATKKKKGKRKDDGARGGSFKKKKKKTATGVTPPVDMSVFMVGLRPNPMQKQNLSNQVWGAAMSYNWALWIVREQKRCLTDKGRPDIRALNRVVVCQNILKIDAALLAFFVPLDLVRFFNKSVGACTKLCAVKSFVQSYQVSKPERAKPREQTEYGTFGIQKAFVKKVDDRALSMIPDILSGSSKRKGNDNRVMRLSSANIPPIDHDVTVTKTIRGRWRLNIPVPISYTRKQPPTGVSPEHVISIDPGVRTFASMYDQTKQEYVEIGMQQDREKLLQRFSDRMDAVKRKQTGHAPTSQFFKDLQIHYRRLRGKVGGIVKYFHTQLASRLVEQCKTVVSGDFKIMERRCPYVNRFAAFWSHGAFRKRLRDRARGTGCEVIVTEEHWTSKSCCVCGKRDMKLGASKTFSCCGQSWDRDLNGAVNIFKKYSNTFVSI